MPSLTLQAKAVASQRAVATGNQIVNTLGGFREAMANGVPAVKNPQTGEVLSPAIPAAMFKQAATDAFGEDGVAKLSEAAELFADDPAPAAQTAPAAKRQSRKK